MKRERTIGTSAVRIGVALVLAIVGCRRGAAPATAAAGASNARTDCASAEGVGRLALTLATQPAAPQTSEALVRLESETERSTVRVNAALGTTFELRPGRYRLNITLAGYNGADRNVQITCGAEETLVVPLSRKR